jgi:hypothetical protein
LSCLRSSIGVSLREYIPERTRRHDQDGRCAKLATRTRTGRKESPSPPKFRKKFQMWTRPGKRSCPPFHWLLCDFQGPRRGGARARGCPGPKSSERPAASRSLKTQQHGCSPGGDHLPDSVDISSGRPVLRPSGAAPKSWERANPQARWSVAGRCPLLSGLPRKEVIQPQLPLRLPCYDFTPVASPTFDGSFPYGLGHRLRVLLTPMV